MKKRLFLIGWIALIPAAVWGMESNKNVLTVSLLFDAKYNDDIYKESLQRIADFLPLKDKVRFASTCRKCQKAIVQNFTYEELTLIAQNKEKVIHNKPLTAQVLSMNQRQRNEFIEDAINKATLLKEMQRGCGILLADFDQSESKVWLQSGMIGGGNSHCWYTMPHHLKFLGMRLINRELEATVYEGKIIRLKDKISLCKKTKTLIAGLSTTALGGWNMASVETWAI